ncbi:MAG: prepilin peptidase [Pseudorhodobacter sp.]|nr:prepilin peptidase [Pseudorhodobacter sp.]
MTTVFATVSLAFFPLTILYAGLGDLATMRIPNRVVVTILLGYAVLAPLSGFSLAQLALGLVAASVVFLLAFGAFACGWMGGGDVKLMAAAALWLGLPQMVAFLLWTSIAGGLLTLALMAYRSLPLTQMAFDATGWASRLHLDRTRVPFGVAIAAGSLIVFASTPWMQPLR